jgi:hypothetical protein
VTGSRLGGSPRERPAAIQPRDVTLRRDREQVEGVDPLAQLTEGVGPGEVVGLPGRLERLLVDSVIDNVLTDPRLSVAVQMDDGREPLKATRHFRAQPLKGIAVDRDRQVGEAVKRAHGFTQ